MSFSIVFLPSAKADIQLAVNWYEKKQYGLGKKFKIHLIGSIDLLNVPEREYGPAFMGLSRIFLKKFPYTIYFNKDLGRNRIVVYAVLHEKQNRSDILKNRI